MLLPLQSSLVFVVAVLLLCFTSIPSLGAPTNPLWYKNARLLQGAPQAPRQFLQDLKARLGPKDYNEGSSPYEALLRPGRRAKRPSRFTRCRGQHLGLLAFADCFLFGPRGPDGKRLAKFRQNRDDWSHIQTNDEVKLFQKDMSYPYTQEGKEELARINEIREQKGQPRLDTRLFPMDAVASRPGRRAYGSRAGEDPTKPFTKGRVAVKSRMEQSWFDLVSMVQVPTAPSDTGTGAGASTSSGIGTDSDSDATRAAASTTSNAPTASNLYISAAVNRLNHVADWANTPDSTLAFAAHKSIAFWSRPGEPDSPQLTQLLATGFSKPITSLKFFSSRCIGRASSSSGRGIDRGTNSPASADSDSDAAAPSIVAGAGDGSLGVWRKQPEASGSTHPTNISAAAQWKRTATLNDAHSGSISAIGVLRPTSYLRESAQNIGMVVSGASDSLLKVWSIVPAAGQASDHVQLIQTIDLGGRFPLDIALIPLPSSDPDPARILMAVSTTTRNIDIYVSEPTLDTLSFVHKLSLEGHEDWVQSLDFCDAGLSTEKASGSDPVRDVIMLASGSQDGSVRLWKITQAEREEEPGGSKSRTGVAAGQQPSSEKADDFERIMSRIEGDLTKADGEISTKAQYFGVGRAAEKWAVTFDALLSGHDNWVTGVRWHPVIHARTGRKETAAKGAFVQPAALLSSSADNSLILWTPTASTGRSQGEDEASAFPVFDQSLMSTGEARRARGQVAHHVASSIWLPNQRFGEVGGASNLGFFGALWRPSADAAHAGGSSESWFEAVMAHGWGGGTHIWTLDAFNAEGKSPSLLPPSWRIASPITGHFGPAKSVAWEPCGEYLLSCSVDQTTRLHARPGALSSRKANSSWHEIARPQSHGYDLHSVSWLDRLNFVSAADEKVIRVFAAPRGFVGSVGPRGLQCATLGSEEESRLGIRPYKGHRFLLVLHDQQGNLPSYASLHGELVRQLAGEVCEREEGSLLVLVVSDRFERLADNDNANRYSFKEIEDYLKWMYAQAWAVAVKKERLFVDINVLLVPSSKLDAMVSKLATISDRAFVDAQAENVFQPAFANAQTPFETISRGSTSDVGIASVHSSSRDSEVDDEKGFKSYRVAALGGTFDHLHVGHKILLSMAALVVSERLIVGVTTDAMLAKKSNANLLEDLDLRRSRVDAFIRLFRLPFGAVKQEVVPLLDIAGPAGTDADVEALILTDETVSGAEFIDKMRKEKGLEPLENWCIGVLGSEGQTDLQGDAKALAESKVGSTAIRKWIAARGARRAYALTSLLRSRQHQIETLVSDAARQQQDGVDSLEASRPVGASVPPLGLSNRAVFEGSTITDGPSESGQPIGKARESLSALLRTPPTEEQLSVETLWPELDKVYGHGYELLWLAANPSTTDGGGRYVASCCRATKAEHAVVRIHDRERNWKEVADLKGHELSVSRMRWSVDARFVISVGRDRSWRAFEKRQDERSGEVAFEPFAGERSHMRIIWDVSFSADASDPYLFATASRDKSVKLFRLGPPPSSLSGTDQPGAEQQSGKPYTLLQTLKLAHPVTAVTFGLGKVLAVGLENGDLVIFTCSRADGEGIGQWTEVLNVKLGEEQVNELAFRPPATMDEEGAVLACAGEDGAVRILRIIGVK